MASLKEIAYEVARRLNQRGVTKRPDDSALVDYFKFMPVDDLRMLSKAILDAKIVGTLTVVELGEGPAGSTEILRLSHNEMQRISKSMMDSGAVMKAIGDARAEKPKEGNKMAIPLEEFAKMPAFDIPKNVENITDSDKKMEALRTSVWNEIEHRRQSLASAISYAKHYGLRPPKEIACPEGDDDIANPAFDAYYAELGNLIDQHPMGLPRKPPKRRKN